MLSRLKGKTVFIATFYCRNFLFSRLQRPTASTFWWLSTVFESSYFSTFSTDHKCRYISDVSFMGGIKCAVCLCFCHFGPGWDTWSVMSLLSHQPVDVYGILKASPTVGGIFMDISQIFLLLCPQVHQINEGAHFYYPASKHRTW